MATVLITWELGGGMGHMACIKPVAEGLLNRGHRVVVALQNFAHASKVFGEENWGRKTGATHVRS